MKVTIDAWKCEIAGCGHRWIAQDSIPPAKCARCKSRKWNVSGIIRTFPPKIADSAPKQALTDLFPNGLLSSDIAVAAILKPPTPREEPSTVDDDFIETVQTILDEDAPIEYP